MTDLRPGRGRRPTDDVRRAALAAAAELLGEGAAGVTFGKVADRSGVSRMTLYKWWPSPGSLAFEAFFHAVEEELAFADTGDVGADLAAQLEHFVEVLGGKGGVLLDLVGIARSDPDLAAALAERYARPRQQLAVDRLATAQAAGQIRADVDLTAVVAQLWGAVYFRSLLVAEPATKDFVRALLDNLLRGVAP